ncbi:hypothetical protein G9A89_019231 [Geosiphon pyriformis]|nr:hypothetical protein G9A89_019231 [Geosiphon pyriformis]
MKASLISALFLLATASLAIAAPVESENANNPGLHLAKGHEKKTHTNNGLALAQLLRNVGMVKANGIVEGHGKAVGIKNGTANPEGLSDEAKKALGITTTTTTTTTSSPTNF